jgi:predicted xylose isomerase-like sugar epimerase
MKKEDGVEANWLTITVKVSVPFNTANVTVEAAGRAGPSKHEQALLSLLAGYVVESQNGNETARASPFAACAVAAGAGGIVMVEVNDEVASIMTIVVRVRTFVSV